MADEDWEQELEQTQEAEKKAEEKKKEEEAKKKEEEKKKEERKKLEEKKKEEEKKKKEEEEKKKQNTNNIPLKSDKDFMLLAQLNASKIKKAKPLPMFTLSYLKNIIELLGETLDMNQVKDIEKIINSVFNKKLTEGVKKKGTTKPVKATVKVERTAEHNDDYDDYNEEEEEEEEQDVNIDNYK